jgi:hypothetical protein
MKEFNGDIRLRWDPEEKSYEVLYFKNGTEYFLNYQPHLDKMGKELEIVVDAQVIKGYAATLEKCLVGITEALGEKVRCIELDTEIDLLGIKIPEGCFLGYCQQKEKVVDNKYCDKCDCYFGDTN